MHIKEKDISMYLDNSLDLKKRERIEKHLSTCEECNARLNKWKTFYSSFELLECDFELDGMENKIMSKIRRGQLSNSVQEERTQIPMPALSYFSLAVFILYLLFEPLMNLLKNFYKNAMAFMLDESLQIINMVKWKALDMAETLEMTGLTACIILIAGGIYFTLNRKSAHKV